jgi:hypothetical protein
MVALAYRDTPLTGATADQLIARDHRLVIASLIGVVAAIPAMILINKIEGRLSLKEEGARIPEWRPWTALR